MGPDSEIEHRGVWWLYPSFLEGCPGPWIGRERFMDDALSTWPRALDWLARRGINFLIADIPPFWKDRIYMGWGYHYVLPFRKYPEARVFSDEFGARNRETIRTIFAEARKRGIRPYTHHYNFCAPVGFVRAHSELSAKLAKRVADGRGNIQDRLGYINGNVCWNEPIYQDFMRECWREFFETFPQAEGIMVTPGECHHCPCKACTGLDDSRGGDEGREDAAIETIGGFIRLFADTLRALGKTPLVRAWSTGHGPRWIASMPRGVTYVFKYSVADCLDGGPDPVIKPWIEAGHTVWISKEITGGANGGPIVWTNPRYFYDVVQRIRGLGVKGAMSWNIGIWGCIGMKYRVQQANFEMFSRYLSRRRRFSEERWRKHFEGIFGPAGVGVLRAMKLSSRVVLGIDRVIFSAGEGYMWMFSYDFKGKPRWPGVLGIGGAGGMEPPEWARREIVSLREYVDCLKTRSWRAGTLADLERGRRNPVAFLEGITADAARGARILERLESEIPLRRAGLEPRAEWLLLRASSRLAVELGNQWTHLVRARILYAGAMGVSPRNLRCRLARECLEEFRLAIQAVKAQMEWVLAYPEGVLDFDRFLGGVKPWERGVPDRVRHLEMQYEEARKDILAALGKGALPGRCPTAIR